MINVKDSSLHIIDKIFILFYFFVYNNGDLYNNKLFLYSSFFLIIIRLSIFLIKSIRFKIKKSIYLIWSSMFLVVIFLSSLWTIDTELTVFGIKTLISTLIPIWYMYLIIKNRKNFYQIINLYVVSMFFVMITIFYKVNLADLFSIRLGTDLLGEGWNANKIGMFFACSVFLIIIMLNKQVCNRIGKNFYLALVPLFIFIALATGSRKTFLILMFCPTFYYFLYYKNNKILKMLIIMISMSLALFLVTSIPALYNLLGNRIETMIYGILGESNGVDGSTLIRMQMIDYGIEWFKEKPFIGYGINTYIALYEGVTGEGAYAHNNYVELLIGLGLIGFLLYYFSYVFLLCAARKSFFFRAEIIVIIIALLILDYGRVSYYSLDMQFLIMISFAALKMNRLNLTNIATKWNT